MAQTRVAADVKAAKAEIERRSLAIQTELLAGGLESAAARRFLDSMPMAADLMPQLSAADLVETFAIEKAEKAQLQRELLASYAPHEEPR